MHSLYSKFIGTPPHQFSPTQGPIGAAESTWQQASSDSHTLRIVSNLADRHNNLMSGAYSGLRKFAEATTISCAMVAASTCLGGAETAYHISATALTAILRNKSPDFMPIEIVVDQGAKAATSLTASIAGCVLAIQCLTKKENLNVTETVALASVGLIDLSEPGTEAAGVLPATSTSTTTTTTTTTTDISGLDPADGG